MATRKAYVVEHLDPELGPWSMLEYAAIAQECSSADAAFYLSSIPANLSVPNELAAERGIIIEYHSAEEIFADRKHRVCLLDPAASADLSPEDIEIFDIFLFGGILGMHHEYFTCFLDGGLICV